MSKMVYLPYVRFEQEEGEAEVSAGTLRSINRRRSRLARNRVHAGLSL